MEASLSSKVTVEYHDPSGLFPLISGQLASRLPLRNLNWKSPTRPLRSIGALHVEFVSDAAKNDPAELRRRGSAASIGENAGSSGGKERRHQIPGLLQTPYLKIYLLRCDDKDAYKATSRQLLRDWIRDNASTPHSSAHSNRSENHDACEWLILHVVIPDTVAASEPRWTAASKKDPDELVERPQSTAKWPGKSTRTVLDKIRADFNSTTKSAPERVAQLRLQKKGLPPHFLPYTPVPSVYTESPQEQNEAWQDLVAKLKTLILMSFDLRVSQYEDDIREKDSQRSLPGWNFCTFFTLKEGLARGFESVGLVDDALAIYDELSAGLETAVADQSTFPGDMNAHRTTLQRTIDSPVDADKTDKQLQEIYDNPLDLSKKDYRGEIVKSTISLFDFHSYIFARQRTLLLRLSAGNAPNPQKRPPSSHATSSKDDNLAFAAEVCSRTATFATTNARTLRKGLQAGSGSENKVSSSQLRLLIDNVASSWTYAVLEQILAETASDKLPLPKSPLDPLSTSPSHQRVGPTAHPKRMSSLGRPISGASNSLQSPQVVYENERFSNPNASAIGQGAHKAARLAAGRAHLLMMQRNILEGVAKRKGWLTGWAALVRASPLTDVDLNTESEASQTEPVHVDAAQPESESESKSESKAVPLSLLLSKALASQLASMDEFTSTYERLSSLALSHFTLSNHTKHIDMVTSDLAVLKYQAGDYALAATLFQKSSPSYLQGNWTYVHAEMLRAYAKCLKELHRRDEYMRVMLSLLSKVILRQRARSLPTRQLSNPTPSLAFLDDDSIDVSNLVRELSVYSQEMSYNFTAPLADFFGDVQISQEVLHYDDKDGFSLDVQFRHLLEESAVLDRVRLRLVSASDPSHEIWLDSDAQVKVEQGLVKLRLHSNITSYGIYLIDKLVLEANKLSFVHEFQPKAKPAPLSITSATNVEQKPNSTGPSVLVYPHGEAFEARASLTRKLHIDSMRSIVLEVDTGRNDIDSLDLRLRAKSAGLRLHTADATVVKGEADLDTSQAGLLCTNAVEPKSKLYLSLPYSLEHNLGEVTVRLEAQYKTSKGTFVFVSTCVIPVELPLDVDVHDIFKAESLISRFSIRTTTSVPLQITNVQLQDSPAFAVQPLPCSPLMTVFEKQPASLAYRITKKSPNPTSVIDRKEATLAMTVQYLCIGDTILNRITSVMEEALQTSPYAYLKRLIVPFLRNGVQSHALALQFEKAVLLQELHLPGYETMGWGKVICDLAVSCQKGLAEWLRSWHRRNRCISYDAAAGEEAREITITVDVPTVDVVHTCSLSILSGTSKTHSTMTATAKLGTPITAELSIKHTRRWASHTAGSTSRRSSAASLLVPEDHHRQGSSGGDGGEASQKFVYTLHDPSDAWLIGGQRRAHFSFSETDDVFLSADAEGVSEQQQQQQQQQQQLLSPLSETFGNRAARRRRNEKADRKFSIVLVPLRLGTYPLPMIDIKPVAPSEAVNKRSSGVWNAKTGPPSSSPSSSQQQQQQQQSGSGHVGDFGAGAAGAGEDHGGDEARVSCETDYLSSGVVVRVVRETGTTTLTVGAGAAAAASSSGGGGFVAGGGGEDGGLAGLGTGVRADARASQDTSTTRLSGIVG